VRDEFLVEAMWERVARGEVDIIGTDHSPFLASEKEPGWDNMWAAPPGAPGIEILVPLMLTAVAYGRISLERMVALLSTNSAAIFGIAGRKGVIAVGADADFMLVDLAAEGRIDTSTWESKSQRHRPALAWSPNTRRRRQHLCQAEQVSHNGQVVGQPGWGPICRSDAHQSRKALPMTLARNLLKAKIATGAMVTGTLAMDMRAPAYVHLLADAGFDSIFFDLEHGVYDLPMVADLIGTARLCGITPIVRVPDLRYGDIARLLDAGAQGVMIPRIDTAAQVEEAMRHIKYPPRGDRGAASVRGATDYHEVPRSDLISHMNNETLVIIQIERAQAITNLDAIASVPGVDVLLVGPYDLAIALGAPGTTDSIVTTAMGRDGRCRQTPQYCHRHACVRSGNSGQMARQRYADDALW
jgi:2-keto-3-deoxy-L-rhamnonate aldolase RhmA